MKKKQDTCVHASAPLVALALACVSILTVLVGSSFAQRSGINGSLQDPSAYASRKLHTHPSQPVGVLPIVVTATAGNTGPTSYIHLQGAFAAINSGVHQGVIDIAVVADGVEVASSVLYASGGTANYTSVSIHPAGGAPRTISGAINAGSPLIDLNGATNVTIDGLNTGGDSLTLSNTTVANNGGTSTIRFRSGAQNNVVTRCTVLGSAVPAPGSIAGNIVFGQFPAVVSNSNNTVSFCNLGPAGLNLPTKAVTGFGGVGALNSGNIIDNNNIFDFFSPTLSASGISILTGNNNWTISNNRIYQTAPRTFTSSGVRYAGITIDATDGSFTVTNNTIGFGAADGTGTTVITGTGSGLGNEVRGIDLANVSTSTPTSVQGNIVSGINQTSALNSTITAHSCFTGIALAAPFTGTGNGLFDVGDVTGNSIGSLDGSSTIAITEPSATANTTPVLGILDLSTQSNVISNNIVGSITISPGVTGSTVGFRGIYSTGTAPAQLETINDNTIDNITDNLIGNYAMYGVFAGSKALSATGNVVSNMNGNANSTGITMAGLAVNAATATQPSTISQNTVHSLTNTVTGGSAGFTYGMEFILPSITGNLIEQNLVHSLNVVSVLPGNRIWGVVMEGQGMATFQNNMVRLGLDAAGNSITTGFSFVGIRDTAGATANYYFNSVYIGGIGVVSASNTLAFSSDVINNTRTFENNIFYNARSNGSGIAFNAAIAVGDTMPNPPGLI